MKVLLITTILGYLAVRCHSQCSMGTTNTWTDAEYQTDPSSLDDPNGTPVGFRRLNYPGTDDQNPRYPCVAVLFPAGSLAIRYLYVLIASPTTVCVRIAGETRSTCSDRNFNICRTNVPSTVNIEFTVCDGGNSYRSCDPKQFSFQYRVVLESSDTDDEFFCNNVNETYPSSLRVLPTDAVTIDPFPSLKPYNVTTLFPSNAPVTPAPHTSPDSNNRSTVLPTEAVTLAPNTSEDPNNGSTVLPTEALTLAPNTSQDPGNGSTVVSPLLLSRILLISLIALLFKHYIAN